MSILDQLFDVPGEFFGHLLATMPTKLGIILRRAVFRLRCARCGPCDIATGVEVRGYANLKIGNGFSMNRNGALHCSRGSIRIGDNCHFNTNVRIGADGGGSVRIGSNVNIGPNTVIDPSNHEFSETDIPISAQGLNFGEIVIEDDVWIGANVVVTQGSHIGRGCVIGAGAIVTRSIPPYCVAFGMPARPVRQRTTVPKDPQQA